MTNPDIRKTRAWAQIDLSAIRANFDAARRHAEAHGARLLAIVKADAYGHGAKRVAAELEGRSGADFFAVATYSEALELIGAGIISPILLLSEVHPSLYGELVRHESVIPSIYHYDSAKGVFASLQTGENKLLCQPMAFNVWRAPTDNDRRIKQKWERLQYRYADSRGIETHCTMMDDCVVIETQVHVVTQSIAVLAKGTVKWTVYANGRMDCHMDLERNEMLPFLPRLGLRMVLPKDYRTLRYFAYGPYESYIDMRRASVLGWFDSDIDSEYTHPLRPQEGGSHYGTQALYVRSAQGCLAVRGEGFTFSALPYTQEQLTDVRHDDELEKTDACILCLDAAHAGIGSHSCGPALIEKYETPAHVVCSLSLDPLAE